MPANTGQGPLDVPTLSVRLRVRTDKPEEVSSNLDASDSRPEGELVFESGDATLPAGHVIRVELGRLPVRWIAYGRWAALGVLLALVGGGSFLVLGRRRHRRAKAAVDLSISQPAASHRAGTPHRGQAARRRKQTGSVRRSR